MEACSWQKVEEWMELYGDRIIRVVYLILDYYHLAEEITQEVFIRAYNSMVNLRPILGFIGLLLI